MPFFDDEIVIRPLKDELPAYLVKAADIPDDFDVLTETRLWWKTTAPDLPSWSSAVQKAILIQLSSAAAERVFSLLFTMFGDQ